ncbi:Bicyclomycin resistance protein [Serratia plymuthica]|uniref:MFS transporter n=1 Tax=Serratia plymuthica TaxID=82996 RepID=UPI0015980EAE|nr:MFS transporter [Serratia plymuthica]QJW56443.1 Bicyclomycin resistance protein [Serratia plymuthica]
MSIDLGVSIQDLGATLSSFFAAFALGQLFVGPLSDRFGRRPLVLLGLMVFVLGSIVCAAATLPQLIVGRVIQALGACATSVLSRAIARDMFVGHVLARTLSLVMVAMAAAPGFSPLLGGALDTLLGWRLNFVVVAALALIVSITYVAKLGESHAPDKRSPLSVSAVARGYVGLLLDKRFIVPAFSAGLIMASLYAFFALGSTILMVNFQLSTLPLGLFFAATVFVVFAGGLLASRLAKRWGAPRGCNRRNRHYLRTQPSC